MPDSGVIGAETVLEFAAFDFALGFMEDGEEHFGG
jgi:hypothetical protein